MQPTRRNGGLLFGQQMQAVPKLQP
eukprot:COSAG02_NODE_53305_length_302_cov_1.492611_1_plen_24_part_01